MADDYNLEGGGEKTVSLDAPEGMSPREGDKITFCVTGMKDGKMMGYFEPMDSGSKDKDDWEKNFLESMSPRNNEQPDDHNDDSITA